MTYLKKLLYCDGKFPYKNELVLVHSLEVEGEMNQNKCDIFYEIFFSFLI